MEEQARRFETDIIQGEEIVDIVRDGNNLVLTSINKREYIAGTVLIATGSKYRKLNIAGEDEVMGTNLHYCATCDGAFYKEKEVLVIGGGNSGFEEGIFLAEKFAKSVKIIEFLPRSESQPNSYKMKLNKWAISKSSPITLSVNSTIADNQLTSVAIENRATGDIHTMDNRRRFRLHWITTQHQLVT